jgi:hypothetical protein
MKKLLAGLFCLSALTLAKADFTSYTLVNQSDPLQFTPTTSSTYDTLSINMLGDGGGAGNFYTVNPVGPVVVSLDFTDTQSITGDTVQLAWYYPDTTSVYEYFSSVAVPGAEFLGSGAGEFTITSSGLGGTITIANETDGWSSGYGSNYFNGFVLTDLTRQSKGPPGVPDSGSTVLLLGVALAGLIVWSRSRVFARQ